MPLLLLALGLLPTSEPPAFKSPSFHIKANQISTIRDLVSSSTYTKILFNITWENQVEPLFIDSNLRISSLKADGNKIEFRPLQSSSWVPVDGKNGTILETQLPQLPAGTKSLALEGKWRAITPQGRTVLEFGKLADIRANGKFPSISKSGLQCSLGEIKQSGNRLSVRLTIQIPKGGPVLDTSQNWVVLNSLNLVSQGKPTWVHDGYLLEAMEEDRAVLVYHFLSKNANEWQKGDWALQYSAITGLKLVEESFRFTAIPTP